MNKKLTDVPVIELVKMGFTIEQITELAVAALRRKQIEERAAARQAAADLMKRGAK